MLLLYCERENASTLFSNYEHLSMYHQIICYYDFLGLMHTSNYNSTRKEKNTMLVIMISNTTIAYIEAYVLKLYKSKVLEQKRL